MRPLIFFLGLTALSLHAFAFGVEDLSNQETVSGLKKALSQSSLSAIGKLGKVNGFLGNDKVKIHLPEHLQKIEGLMRALGMSRQADELVTSMNRAAEAAVPEAKALFLNAIRQMTIEDAKGILAGGNDATTQYFKKTTSAPLSEKFLPIVKSVTGKVGLAKKYNSLAGKAAEFGLLDAKDAGIESYVTQRTLDGLFYMMAEEEKAIRQDPLGQTSKIIRKVFGAAGF